MILFARLLAALFLWQLPPPAGARKLLRSLDLQAAKHLAWWIWFYLAMNPFLPGQMDFIGIAFLGLTLAPILLLPRFRRRIESELGRLAGTGRLSVGRLLLVVPAVVLAIIAVFMIPGSQLPTGPPISMSGLAGALVFLAVWWRTGRIGRYHLLAAIVSGLAVVVFSPVVVGAAFGGYEGFFTRPAAAVFVWTGMLFFVAMVDGVLLKELRKIVTPAPSEVSNP